MITTVTTATTTTVTTVSAASFTLVAVCAMMILLLNKELILASKREWAVRLSRAMNVAIVPLLIVFFSTVVINIANVLR